MEIEEEAVETYFGMLQKRWIAGKEKHNEKQNSTWSRIRQEWSFISAVKIHISVICFVTPCCSLAGGFQHFRGIYFLHLQRELWYGLEDHNRIK
jgi:hypothetical protein